MPSPLLAARQRLDRWLRRQEARVLGPHYRRWARQWRERLSCTGLTGLGGPDDVALARLGRARAGLFAEALVHVAAGVPVAYRQLLEQTYGRPLAATLRARPPRLFAADEASRAALTILDLPDRYGYRYSARLWRSDQESLEELRRALQNAAASGQLTWREASRLRGLMADDPQLPRALSRLHDAARAVLQGLPQAQEAWRTALRQARTEIAHRQPAPRGTRAFQERTVRRLEAALRAGQEARLQAAVDYFLAQRARARALVILRSEVNRAFHETSLAIYRASPWVVGVRWTLSARHLQTDECDAKAEADVGLGPGVYYVQDLPLPDHPNGACGLEPVLAPPALAAQSRPPTPPSGYAAVLDRLRQGALPRAWNRAGRLGEAGALAEARQALAALTRGLPRPEKSP